MTDIEVQYRKVRGLAAIVKLRQVLSKYTFAGSNEEQVARQVLLSLGMARAYGEDAIDVVGTEVIVDAGRFDILVDVSVEEGKARVVLELKVRGTAGAAERQAQRYAHTDGVDAVAIVTTSNRLARELVIGGGEEIVHQTLGGKPFGVITLRAF